MTKEQLIILDRALSNCLIKPSEIEDYKKLIDYLNTIINQTNTSKEDLPQ